MEGQREREREADFPQQTQCGVGISGSVVRAAPPLKHREGQSVRGKTSGAAEGAQECADSSRRWTGAVEEVVEGRVLNSDVWEAEQRVGWIRRAGWGLSEDRSEVQCCRAALGSPN